MFSPWSQQKHRAMVASIHSVTFAKVARIINGFLLFGTVSLVVGQEYLRVCYYTSWARYRSAPMNFTADDVDVRLCTHIIFAFARMEGNNLAPWDNSDVEMYGRLVALKEQKPELKVLLGVGGWLFGTRNMSLMLATPRNRAHFVRSSRRYLMRYGFDGLDLDFEFPAHRGSPPEDKQRFTYLCRGLGRAFRRTGLLLTAAVSGIKETIDKAYEARKIGKELDLISIMAYDLHDAHNSHAGHNSPLYARSGERGTNRRLNVNWVANYWAWLGVPRHKIVVGMPIYGRSYLLSGPDTDIGAPISGAAMQGRFVGEPGYWAYYEICEKNSTRVFHREHEVPYAYGNASGRMFWVGYDDTDSCVCKIQWVKEMKFRGIMIWALDLDDFNGNFCGGKKYPMISCMVDHLKSDSISNTSFCSAPLTHRNKYIPTYTESSSYSMRATLLLTSIPLLWALLPYIMNI